MNFFLGFLWWASSTCWIWSPGSLDICLNNDGCLGRGVIWGGWLMMLLLVCFSSISRWCWIRSLSSLGAGVDCWDKFLLLEIMLTSSLMRLGDWLSWPWGSWRVVWWNPLQTWHRFCDGHDWLWCLLLKQFVHKLLWLTRLYQSLGEHNWYSGQVAMLHFSQDRFVLKVLYGTFCEVDGCFCRGAKFQCFLLFSADALLTDNGRLLLYGLVCRLFELTNFEAWELMVLWLLSRFTLS